MGVGKVVLGLDVGIGSVGWGLVSLQEEKYPVERSDGTVEEKYKISDGKIIAAGVRTFQLPQDREKKSLALKRGTARRGRWRLQRRVQRLKKLIALAKEFKLIPDDFNREAYLKPQKGVNEGEKWDIWRIRKEALERKLSDIELFRILYHIAKHRGSYFHTKAEFLPEKDEEKPTRGKKNNTGDDEREKVKKGLRRVQKLLQDKGYRTIGQMFWVEFKQLEHKRKRNAKDKYENSIPRVLLRDEIIEIFKEQQKIDSLRDWKALEQFKQQYIDNILMHEEGIDEDKLKKMMSHCEFTGKICAPKESYTAEEFSLFNRLNTLEIIDTQNKDKHLLLDDKQREKIIALAYKDNKVTFFQIRTELGFQNDLHLRFNLCSYKEKNPEYKKALKCKIENTRLDFEEKHKIPVVNLHTGEIKVFDEEIKTIFRKKLQTNNKDGKEIYVYYSDIRKELNLSDDFRFETFAKEYTKSATELGSQVKYIKQFEDADIFIALAGYHKIRVAIEKRCGAEKWEQLRNNKAALDAIAEALAYCKSDETRTDYLRNHGITNENIIDAVLTLNMKQLASFSSEAMCKLLTYMRNGVLFNEAKEQCGYGKITYEKQGILQPYSGFFEKNPVVARVISQTRKIVNAIVRKYGDAHPIDEIHIEVSTELASSEERKNEIAGGQKRYRDEKEAAKERCREFGLDPEEGQNLLMFRLAEQQKNKCPYTNKAITYHPTGATDEVYIRDCEIDHIIPMSRSFNDSLNNKVLCSPEANQNKKDMIPFEWFEKKHGKDSVEWRNFKNIVEKMYGMPYAKRKNLLRMHWTEEDKQKYIDRDINDTRYAARHIADYLRKYFDFSKSKRDDITEVNRIQLRSGGITAFLRHMWGLNKDRDENDLHHAMDALVVACATYGHVYLVSNLAKAIERKGKNWYKHFGRDKFKPWGTIREDIQNTVETIFVSRMPRHKVTAGAHKDSVKSMKEMPFNRRVVKINSGYADIGNMIRADVFVDKQGKNYVVPVYAVDISAKTLPDKYVPDDSKIPYDQWPTIEDDKMEFRFSLFKDDLVEINNQKYYVSFFEATTTNINVENINSSVFPDKIDAKSPKIKKITYRPSRGKCVLRKYSVDLLGNYKEVTQEKRLGVVGGGG